MNPAATARSLRRWAATRSRHEEDLTLKSPFSRSIAIGARSWDSAASRRRSAFSRWLGAPTWTRQQVSLAALPRGDPGAGRAGGLEPAGGVAVGGGREPSETPLGGDGWEAAVSAGGVAVGGGRCPSGSVGEGTGTSGPEVSAGASSATPVLSATLGLAGEPVVSAGARAGDTPESGRASARPCGGVPPLLARARGSGGGTRWAAGMGSGIVPSTSSASLEGVLSTTAAGGAPGRAAAPADEPGWVPEAGPAGTAPADRGGCRGAAQPRSGVTAAMIQKRSRARLTASPWPGRPRSHGAPGRCPRSGRSGSLHRHAPPPCP